MDAMRRLTLLLPVLLLVPGTALAASIPGSPASPPVVAATPPPAAGNDAINVAVAGVLISTLTEQFGGRAVSLMLDSVNVQPASISDCIVSGEGRARIGDDPDWIGFRFSTLYDTTFGSAAYPDISLGGVTGDERNVPNDPALLRQLDDRVAERLDGEFSGQPVRLQLDSITTVEAGTRYLRINASGIADFGPEGTTPTRIEALYDRRDGAWLRVNYELGASGGLQSLPALAGS
ncbi:MAG TPA: hypothetical protein VFF71_03500 [Luteimonas sp.]|nr:hypothetical protein [Luteimonas sp.]